MCSLAICWYIVLTTCSLLGVNELRKKWIYILLLWSNVFDSCDILRLFAGQAGFRRYYQEKMASPEKMPQVVCWTLLLITALQISFVSWTVVNELEDLKVLKLEKRHCEWWFNQWINVLQVLVLHGFSWHCWMGQIRWIWGFDCVHELWSCDTVNRNYFFRPGTDLRCLRLSFFIFSKLSEFAFEFSKKKQDVIFKLLNEWFPIHDHFQMICWYLWLPIFMGGKHPGGTASVILVQLAWVIEVLLTFPLQLFPAVRILEACYEFERNYMKLWRLMKQHHGIRYLVILFALFVAVVSSDVNRLSRSNRLQTRSEERVCSFRERNSGQKWTKNLIRCLAVKELSRRSASEMM